MEKDARVRDEDEKTSEEHLSKVASQLDDDDKQLREAVEKMNQKPA